MRGSNTAGAHREDRRCRIIGFIVAGGAMIFLGIRRRCETKDGRERGRFRRTTPPGTHRSSR